MKFFFASAVILALLGCSQQPLQNTPVNTPNPESAKHRSDQAHGELDREMK